MDTLDTGWHVDWRPAAVWSGRGFFFSEVCLCLFSLLVRSSWCRPLGWVSLVPRSAGSSGGVASVVPGSFVLAGLFAVSVPITRRSFFQAGGSLRSLSGAFWLGVASVVERPCVGFLRRAAPSFFGASPDRCGGTLPAGAGCAGRGSSTAAAGPTTKSI